MANVLLLGRRLADRANQCVHKTSLLSQIPVSMRMLIDRASPPPSEGIPLPRVPPLRTLARAVEDDPAAEESKSVWKHGLYFAQRLHLHSINKVTNGSNTLHVFKTTSPQINNVTFLVYSILIDLSCSIHNSHMHNLIRILV